MMDCTPYPHYYDILVPAAMIAAPFVILTLGAIAIGIVKRILS